MRGANVFQSIRLGTAANCCAVGLPAGCSCAGRNRRYRSNRTPSVSVRRLFSRHESDAYAEYDHRPVSDCDGVAKSTPTWAARRSARAGRFRRCREPRFAHEEPDGFAPGLQMMTACPAVGEVTHRSEQLVAAAAECQSRLPPLTSSVSMSSDRGSALRAPVLFVAESVPPARRRAACREHRIPFAFPQPGDVALAAVDSRLSLMAVAADRSPPGGPNGSRLYG